VSGFLSVNADSDDAIVARLLKACFAESGCDAEPPSAAELAAASDKGECFEAFVAAILALTTERGGLATAALLPTAGSAFALTLFHSVKGFELNGPKLIHTSQSLITGTIKHQNVGFFQNKILLNFIFICYMFNLKKKKMQN
jgi:hypothetical protein